MIVIGIDPGVTGAVGQIGHRAELQHLADLPTIQRAGGKAHVLRQVDPAGLAALLAEWLHEYSKNEVRVFLETPIAFPGLHVAAIGASFLNAGICEGAVAARGYAIELVAPHVWKKALGLTKDKERCRAAAVRLWPDAALTRMKDHNRAEALLLAKYGHGRVA